MRLGVQRDELRIPACGDPVAAQESSSRHRRRPRPVRERRVPRRTGHFAAAVALVLLVSVLTLATSPAHAPLDGIPAQSSPPLTGDSRLTTVTWPGALQAWVRNNTSQPLRVTVQFEDFTDATSGITLPPSKVLQPYTPTITLAPATQVTLTLPVRLDAELVRGSYVTSLVLTPVPYNTPWKKQFTLVVDRLPTLESQAQSPAVSTWRLTAVRILPFLRPVCVRGLVIGCTLPVQSVGTAPDASIPLGILANERGGGLLVSLKDYQVQQNGTRHNALLELTFDHMWGLTGTYTGDLTFPGQRPSAVGTLTDEGAAATPMALTVTVKDTIIWPVLCLAAGIGLALYLQKLLSVQRPMLKLHDRLNDAALTVDGDDEGKPIPVRGYTIADDLVKRRAELEEAIEDWGRNHFGPPTEAEGLELESRILKPLADFETQLQVWNTFADRLDTLRNQLEKKARPAFEKVQKPAGIDLKEPRCYTTAQELLKGRPLTLAEVSDYAARIDNATELAEQWGDIYHAAALAGSTLGQLRRSNMQFSKDERKMLEEARHNTYAAVHDLWEAKGLEELQSRATRDKLARAQELLRRLVDPFIEHATSVRRAQMEADARRAATTKGLGSEAALPMSFSIDTLTSLYDKLRNLRLPRLNMDAYQALPSDAARRVYLDRALLVSERIVTVVALVVALIIGLDRYFTTDFGTLADYLALFTWAFVTKAGLELVNVGLSRYLPRPSA